jgi:hypothetical protein
MKGFGTTVLGCHSSAVTEETTACISQTILLLAESKTGQIRRFHNRTQYALRWRTLFVRFLIGFLLYLTTLSRQRSRLYNGN